MPSEAYVRDLALSATPMTGKRDLPYDRAVRTGLVRSWHEDRVLPHRDRCDAAAWGGASPDPVRPPQRVDRRRVEDDHPGRRMAAATGPSRIASHLRGSVAGESWSTWTASRSPSRRSTSSRLQAGVRNRPPHAISAALRPASPTAQDVVECLVSTSLARGGSRLRHRALPVPLDRRRQARSRGAERSAVGRAAQRSCSAREKRALRGHAERRAALRADASTTARSSQTEFR